MNTQDVKRDAQGISAFLRFLQLFSFYDNYRLDARLDAVEAISIAARETRAWTTELRQRKDGLEVVDRGPEISELWSIAANKIAKFDTLLASECFVKSFGWRTGQWGNPAYDEIPRRVEEVHAQALKLLKDYEPVLGRAAR